MPLKPWASGAKEHRVRIISPKITGRRKGDRLKVRLSGSSAYTWTEPATSDKAVLRRTGGSSGPTASATFLATAEGKVDITAIDNPNCYPQCLAPSRLFRVTVSVSA